MKENEKPIENKTTAVKEYQITPEELGKLIAMLHKLSPERRTYAECFIQGLIVGGRKGAAS